MSAEILFEFGAARSVTAAEHDEDWNLFFGPGVQEAAEENELAEVIGVVVDEENGFGSEGLVVGVGQRSEDVGFFEGGDELFAVGAE